jgi:hypothetical protein
MPTVVHCVQLVDLPEHNRHPIAQREHWYWIFEFIYCPEGHILEQVKLVAER